MTGLSSAVFLVNCDCDAQLHSHVALLVSPLNEQQWYQLILLTSINNSPLPSFGLIRPFLSLYFFLSSASLMNFSLLK